MAAKRKKPQLIVDQILVDEKESPKEWSLYQKDIFQWVSNRKPNDSKNLVVVARAGAAKTTTAIECLNRLPQHNGKPKAIYLAFNTRIVEEMRSKINEDICVVKTLSAFGLNVLKLYNPKVEVMKDKGYYIAKRIIGEDPKNYDDVGLLNRLATLAKSYLYSSTEEIDWLMDRFEIEAVNFERDVFIKFCQRALKDALDQDTLVDFADMIYLPVIKKLKMDWYDWVFLDEAQDMTKGMIALALAAKKQGGNSVFLGDDRQALYGFAGADENAIQNIITASKGDQLSLPITYRCGTEIVKLAQEIVPDYQAGPKNQSGNVQQLHPEMVDQLIKPGDFFLSRYNAPLVSWCLSFLRAKKRAYIRGKNDVAMSLLTLIKKSKKKTIKDLIDYLESWRAKEIKRLTQMKRSVEAINDKVDCILAFCEEAKSIKELNSTIETLFQDADSRTSIVLSSVHAAKGLEADNVFVLSNTLRQSSVSEANITYVAYTRAKNNLYLIKD